MSTLRVDNITDLGDDPVVTDGVITSVPGRNLLYNGAMQVAQRGTSSTGITGTGFYSADRWNLVASGLGTWTQTVEADGPTGSGFSKSLKMECTTADAAPASTDVLLVRQRLEGQDVQSLKKGTSSAESLTLSFWVKSNVTGTYIASLKDADNSRYISQSYTVSSSATWEKKTITFAGDTTGVLDNDNAVSLEAIFWLGAGSNSTSGTLATSWETETAANRAVGQTNLAASTSNYWQVTGVQLEAGTVATPFEHKAYGVELAECQRYYFKTFAEAVGSDLANGWNGSTTLTRHAISTPVTMRIAPTSLEQSGNAGDYGVRHTALTTCSVVPVFYTATPNFLTVQAQVSSGLTQGQGSSLRAVTTDAFLAWSAEL